MIEQIYGIDLGTTYSCVSGFDENGKNIVFVNKDNEYTTPSVLVFDERSRQVSVGIAAKNESIISPSRTVMCVKRNMGTNRRFQPETKDEFRAETLSAFILKKLIKDVKDEYKIDVRRAVITCPAYFGVNEREATKRAGELAGLDVVSIINEPSAAAFYYGIEKNGDGGTKNVLVYDLGGGTFDVTVIRISEQSLEVLATGGDSRLGGVDWDDAIAQYFVDRLSEECRLDADVLKADEAFMTELRQKAEHAKKLLSQSEKSRESVDYRGNRCIVEMSRSEFESITNSLLEQTTMLCESVVSESGVSKESIAEVLLVGGSSRMPQVARAVGQWFGRPPKLCNPDEAVARGAALYAQQMAIKEIIVEDTGLALPEDGDDAIFLDMAKDELSASAKQDILTLTGTAVENKRLIAISNVCSKSFGNLCRDREYFERTGCVRQIVVNIIKKNSRLPISVEESFCTIEDGQTSVKFTPMENEQTDNDVAPEDCVQMGEFWLRGLPPNRPKDRPLKVRYSLDAQGLLDIVYTDVETGMTATAQLQTTYVISDEEMKVARKQLAAYTIN